MTVIEHGSSSFDGDKPVKDRSWYSPGMSPAEIRLWEAAERAAAQAPEIRPGDDVWRALEPLLGGCLAPDKRPQHAHDPAA